MISLPDQASEIPASETPPSASPGSSDWHAQLEGYRGYLLAVASREIRPEFRGRLAASDLVQLTLADAALAWDRFATNDAPPQPDDVLRWLRRILDNNLCDGIRQVTSAKRAVGREVRLRKSSILRGVSAPRRERPDVTAMRREEVDNLDRAIANLPAPHRRAILLRHRDQASFAEIGLELGISENAAQKLWTRAVDSLRARLKTAR